MLTIDLLSHPEEFQIDSARISAVIGNLRSVSWATRKCVVSYGKLCWYSNIKLWTTKNGQDWFVLMLGGCTQSFGTLSQLQVEIWECPQFSWPQSIRELWTNVSRCVKMRTWICYWFWAENGPRMYQLDEIRSQLATTDLFRNGQRPLMTSQRCDDVTIEIFKIALHCSESIENAYNRSFKSPCRVSDR